MAERQAHAFDYEKRIIFDNNIIKNENYTGKWDATENGKPVSIKMAKKGSSVDFGDFRRQTLLTEDFLLYVGFWSGQKDNVIEEYKILVSVDNWKKYFGNVSILDNMLSEMKQISNDHSDDKKWTEFRKKYDKLYKINNNKPIIALRFKRDHKAQKRIQCGIANSNLKQILKENTIIYEKKY